VSLQFTHETVIRWKPEKTCSLEYIIQNIRPKEDLIDMLAKLRTFVIEGDTDNAVKAAEAFLGSETPVKEVVDTLTEAMQHLGQQFENFEIFLPELVVAADAFMAAMDVLKPKIEMEHSASGLFKKPVAVIGTVSGDYHEIGKTVVGLVLQANGFEVVDLGSDVDPVRFMDEALKHKASIVGLSALMTTTMPAQQEFIRLLKEAGMDGQFRVMIGGAPTSREWADSIGADGWAFDAFAAVAVAKDLASGA
jgi:trimethylamine corrinoid protein